MTTSESTEPSSGFLLHRVGGVPFAVADETAALDYIQAAAVHGVGVSVRLANAYCVAVASRDDGYRGVLVDHGVNFADGVPVAYLLGQMSRLPMRSALVRGPSLFARAIRERELRSFYIGATEDVLRKIEIRLLDEGARSQYVGGYAPPYAPVSDQLIEEMAARVNATDADVVWVGMGTPKQDYVTTRLAPLVHRPCVGVGAAFDFYAGTVAEAPAWLRGSGLEWGYRLVREPRRLTHRYTVGSYHFARAVMRSDSR